MAIYVEGKRGDIDGRHDEEERRRMNRGVHGER